MIRLQRTLARKQEKIEFMEEHSATLVEDIKKKNRLIQNYVLNKETSGALTSSSMDQNKVGKTSKIITGILTFSYRILFPLNTYLVKKNLVGKEFINFGNISDDSWYLKKLVLFLCVYQLSMFLD